MLMTQIDISKTVWLILIKVYKSWYAIYHSTCQGVAFYSSPAPVDGMKLLLYPENVMLLDNTKPILGTAIHCGSCGAIPYLTDLKAKP